MLHKTKVLVIGRHADLLNKITNMLKQHGYSATGKQWNDEAIEAFTAETIDAVVIGGGVDKDSREFFHTEFSRLNPLVKIIDAHPHTVLNELNKAIADKQQDIQ